MEEFHDLFYLSEFQQNLLRIDFNRGFEEILINKGFTIKKNRYYEEPTNLIKHIKRNEELAIKLEEILKIQLL